MKRIVLAAALLATACSSRAPALTVQGEAAETVTVFEGIAVFAGDATAATANQDVWIRGGRIEYVGPAGERALPAGAKRVPGAGRTLLPGLIDLHVHTSGGGAPPWALALPDPEKNLRAFLYAGVTTIVDLGGPLAETTGRRDKIAAGELVGPRLLVAGSHFTAPDGHPVAMLRLFTPWFVSLFLEPGFAYQVDSTAAVADMFDDFLEARPDVVKITSDQIPLGVPTIAPEVAAEVVARAHAAGLTAFAHVGDNADAQKVARAGVDILAHGIYREAISDETAALLAAEKVAVVPTLAVFDHIDRLTHDGLALAPMQKEVGDAEVVAAIEAGPGDYEVPGQFQGWIEATHAHRATKFDNVAKLRAAGVEILVGSDSPNLGQFAGASLHDELDLLVQAGMTPGEVLRAATYLNAAALKLDAEIGAVAPGKRADLLIVEGDPTADIAAVHRIADVYVGGRRVERALP